MSEAAVLLDAQGRALSRAVAVKEDAPPVVAEPQSLLPAIIQLSRDPSVDVAKLQAILDMQERLEKRESERAFNEAFAQMEPKLPRIARNGVVEYPVNKNDPKGPKEKAFNFARYEDLDHGIRPILREHGFSLSFSTAPRSAEGGGLVVTGVLLHSGGHSKEASIPLPLDTSGGKNNLQGGASTFSYGRRYTTTMLLNIVTEGADDDGKTGGTPYLTMEQIDELRRLMVESGSEEAKFLRTMTSEAEALEDVEQRDYGRLHRALLVKANNKKPEASGAKLDKLEQAIIGGKAVDTKSPAGDADVAGRGSVIGDPPDTPAGAAQSKEAPEVAARRKWVNDRILDIEVLSSDQLRELIKVGWFLDRRAVLLEENPDLDKRLAEAITARWRALDQGAGKWATPSRSPRST
jgi:hypothetical protein